MADPWHIGMIELSARLVTATALGGLIGYEREMHQHAAGLRTNILVCLGSSLIMLLSIYGFNAFRMEANVQTDPARLAAQVISGIGFLGAGTIMKTGVSIKGLTTAATLWVVAGIGLAIGAGFYYPAVLTCGLVLLALKILNHVEHRYLSANKPRVASMKIKEGSCTFNEICEYMTDKRIIIKAISVERSIHAEECIHHITFRIASLKHDQFSGLLRKINEADDVLSFKIDN
ncbi:putative Mg(2+) transport ATPase [compost metagenome]